MNRKKLIAKVLLCILYLGIMMILTVACYYLYQEKQVIVPWSKAENVEDYTYLDISKMSEKFAYDKENKVEMHFVIETEETGLWHTYLIAIKEEDSEFFKEIIDYTYKRTDTIPEKIRVYGYPVIVDEKTKDLAIQNIKDFLPEENEIVITNENYEEYLTNSYLDTTKARKEEFSILLCACMVLLLIVTLLFIMTIIGKKEPKKKTRKKTWYNKKR